MSEKLEEMERLNDEEPDMESRPPPAKKRRQTEKRKGTKLASDNNRRPLFEPHRKKPSTMLVVGSEPSADFPLC